MSTNDLDIYRSQGFGGMVGIGRSLAEIAADKSRTYVYLLRVSMIASLRRAQELG